MENLTLERPAQAGTAPGTGRDVGLDLIRALAGFLVLSVHFFLNNGYYAQPLVGKRMLLMTMMRMGFMTCVPLFLLLTGYLCRKKTLTPRYYLGLVRILLTYGLCGGACLIVRAARGEAVGLREAVKGFLNFSAAPYAWYIEMYIGLFLLIPFLDLIWRGLESQRGRLALVGTLLALTTLPALTNARWTLLPDWWIQIYPITYYFLGAYLGDHPPKVPWGRGIAALLAVVAAEGAAAYLLAGGGAFQWNIFTDWGGPGVVASSVLLFALIRQIPAERAPRWLRWLIYKGSELSLGIYLISWCFDTLFYPILAQRVPEMPDRLFWYFAIVPAVYLCSALAAQALEWIRKAITWALNKCFPSLALK